MKTTISLAAMAAVLSLGASAFAQQAPVGGPEAKGNAPLKHAHTVNDGSAKPAANSFTEKQARQHIEHAGYTDVSPLAKGSDGVWRGTATRSGSSRSVALDFKGNVSDTDGASGAMAGSSTSHGGASRGGSAGNAGSGTAGVSEMGSTSASSTTTTAGGAASASHRHHRRHHARSRCANPAPNGAACSGVDKNANGISDKEDRAIAKGAHP